MRLHLLHTASAHRGTFDRLQQDIAPTALLEHHVHEAWLERARRGHDPQFERDIKEAMAGFDGPVLCTCSTIGPMAEAAGALRIDAPMMQAAAGAGGRVLLVYCLESTKDPSLTLLKRAIQDVGNEPDIVCLALPSLWSLFETGETTRFTQEIATRVQAAVSQDRDIKSVVLAQASMAAAAEQIGSVGALVLSSPTLAFQALLDSHTPKAG